MSRAMRESVCNASFPRLPMTRMGLMVKGTLDSSIQTIPRSHSGGSLSIAKQKLIRSNFSSSVNAGFTVVHLNCRRGSACLACRHKYSGVVLEASSMPRRTGLLSSACTHGEWASQGLEQQQPRGVHCGVGKLGGGSGAGHHVDVTCSKLVKAFFFPFEYHPWANAFAALLIAFCFSWTGLPLRCASP